MKFYDIDTHYFPEGLYNNLPEPYKSLAPQFNWKTYTEEPEWWNRIYKSETKRDGAFATEFSQYDWKKPMLCDDKGYLDIDIFPGGKSRHLVSVKEGLSRGLAAHKIYGGPHRGDLNYSLIEARNLQERKKELDRLGIDKAIIKPYSYMLGLNYRIDADLAIQLAKAYNNAVLKDCKNEDRFWPLIWFPAQNRDMKENIKIIEDGLSKGGVGVILGEHFSYAEHTLGRPWGTCDWMEPIWDHANKHQYPIFFHVLDCFYDFEWYKWRDKNDKKHVDQWHIDHDHLTSLIYSNTWEGKNTGIKGQYLSFASLMTEGVLDRYPNLKLNWCERGINWVMPLLKHMENVFKKDFIKYKKNWAFTIEPEAPNFEKDAEELGYDHLLFSTDFPHMDPGGRNRENDIPTVLNLNTNEINKEKIANLNAKRIFANTSFVNNR
jgi:predicted TIM-barrel fold metal-dependent hydrolase